MFRIRAWVSTASLYIRFAGENGLSEEKIPAEIEFAHRVLLQLAQTPGVDVHLPRYFLIYVARSGCTAVERLRAAVRTI